MYLSASLIFTVCLASLVSSAPDPKESKLNGVRSVWYRPLRHQESKRPREGEIVVGHRKIPHRILRSLPDVQNIRKQNLNHLSDILSILSSSGDIVKLVMEQIRSKFGSDSDFELNLAPDIEVFANDREFKYGGSRYQDDEDDQGGPVLYKNNRGSYRAKRIRESQRFRLPQGIRSDIKFFCSILKVFRGLREVFTHSSRRGLGFFSFICNDLLDDDEGEDAGGKNEQQSVVPQKEAPAEDDVPNVDPSKDSFVEVDAGEDSPPGELLYEKP